MPLSAAIQLGPYQILAPIGAAGGSEVDKASDTRRERTVASSPPSKPAQDAKWARRAPLIACFWMLWISASLVVAQDHFELEGKIRRQDGRGFRGITPVVFLQGAITPFTTHTLAGPDGSFKFKKLLPGMYTLIIAVPKEGRMEQTVEIGPSFADAKGRIKATYSFETNRRQLESQVVSAQQLSISDQAHQEYEKALARLSQRDVSRAIEHLERAVEIAPRFATAWNHLGTIAYQSQQYRQAEEHFRRALKEDPHAYSPLVNLGGALLSQGRSQESLEVNLQAVEERPDDALAHSQLGHSYFLLNRLEEAETHLKQAKALDPAHFSSPQLILAEIYRMREDAEAAAAELEDFLARHPDSDLAPGIKESIQRLRSRTERRPPD